VVKTPLNTNIDVNMLLANGSYNFIQTKNTVFGVGLGYGRTDISLNITPDVGNPIIYDGQQPFGFLNLHMSSNYKRFLYGFALNGSVPPSAASRWITRIIRSILATELSTKLSRWTLSEAIGW